MGAFGATVALAASVTSVISAVFGMAGRCRSCTCGKGVSELGLLPAW